MYKVTECTGSMSRLCKRKNVFDWKIWQVVLAFWAQETTNFSLWQISVILRTVTKDIFTLHFHCQSIVLSLLRLHPVIVEKICVLSLSYLCKKYRYRKCIEQVDIDKYRLSFDLLFSCKQYWFLYIQCYSRVLSGILLFLC